jgi:hypothetical protein
MRSRCQEISIRSTYMAASPAPAVSRISFSYKAAHFARIADSRGRSESACTEPWVSQESTVLASTSRTLLVISDSCDKTCYGGRRRIPDAKVTISLKRARVVSSISTRCIPRNPQPDSVEPTPTPQSTAFYSFIVAPVATLHFLMP